MASSLTGTKLADQLRRLRRRNASGVLAATAGEGTALVVLQGGKVVYASSDRVAPIGRRLVGDGLVTEAALATVLSLQRRKKSRELIVGMLCDLGVLDRADAAVAIEDHIVTVLGEIASWPECELRFTNAEGELDRIVFPPRNGDIEVLLERAGL